MQLKSYLKTSFGSLDKKRRPEGRKLIQRSREIEHQLIKSQKQTRPLFEAEFMQKLFREKDMLLGRAGKRKDTRD